MKKYLYAMFLLGAISNVSATFEDSVASPKGHHGETHGGMIGSTRGVTTFPLAVTVKLLAADGACRTSVFHIDRQTRVAEFKAALIQALQIPAAHRLIWAGYEVMKESVASDGRLFTLEEIFGETKDGMPVIEIVMDPSRSPMMTPAPLPDAKGDVSPLKDPTDSE